MKKEEKYSLPTWMRIDNRPMDRGEWQTYGYGYSRNVGRRELWRPAMRYFIRRGKTRNAYEEVQLMPDVYYVSDHGRIYSARKKRIIKIYRKHKRKVAFLATNSGKFIKIRPYKLALDNWIEPSESIRSVVRYLMNTVNHKDGKSWNDKLSNLQYSPLSANLEHQVSVLHKVGKRKKGTTHGKAKCNA